MDREEAKTELQDLTNAIEELENRFPIKNPANQKTITALKIAIEALEQTRWIPVSERLPENGIYLICTDDGYIATIMYDRSMGWLLNSNIVAWMPLPPSYEQQESEG